jgi:DNA-binding PadR family transcriptional regulator
VNASLTTDEVPILSHQEVAILVVLAEGPRTGYEIMRQYEPDFDGDLSISTGTLYPALRRCRRSGLIEEVESTVLRPGAGVRVHRLTDLGQMVLGWQLDIYDMMVDLGRERLRALAAYNKKPPQVGGLL